VVLGAIEEGAAIAGTADDASAAAGMEGSFGGTDRLDGGAPVERVM
jgi:hypothetical protein